MKYSLIIILAAIVFASAYIYSYKINTKPSDSKPTAPANTMPDTKLEVFEEIGISMEIPTELDVVKTPNYYQDRPDVLDVYTFYIQNYHDNGAIDFQMYGLYQLNIPDTTWEELSKVTSDTQTYSYAKEIEINGIKGYETQLAGERNNYVYLFLVYDHLLRIAVSPATPENKLVADHIISTMRSR